MTKCIINTGANEWTIFGLLVFIGLISTTSVNLKMLHVPPIERSVPLQTIGLIIGLTYKKFNRISRDVMVSANWAENRRNDFC